MKIAFVNQKGGVAKTVSTFTIGNILASKGKKVLLIDLDPQASLTLCCGIDPLKRVGDAGGNAYQKNMYDVISNRESIEAVTVHGICDKENLSLAPSNIVLSKSEIELITEIGRENILKKALETVEEKYDFILMDCPPSLSFLVINALSAADRVIIPVSSDYLAYQAMLIIEDSITKVSRYINPGLTILGIIVTLHDPRTLHNQEVLQLLSEKGYNILGVTGISTKVKDAVLSMKSIYDISPKHPIAKAYEQVAEVIVNGC